MILTHIVVTVLNLYCYLRNKKSIIIVTLSFLYLVMSMGGHISMLEFADYYGYKSYYETQIFPESMEIGFVKVCNLLFSIGLSFEEFYFFYQCIQTILFLLCSYWISKDFHAPLMIYLLCSVFTDVDIMRQAMVYVLYFLALILYSKEYRIFAILVICCAVTFQRSLILAIPFFLFYKEQHISFLEKNFFFDMCRLFWNLCEWKCDSFCV